MKHLSQLSVTFQDSRMHDPASCRLSSIFIAQCDIIGGKLGLLSLLDEKNLKYGTIRAVNV